eukprot:1005570-Pleurochrysis_carterae.AAC.1
MAYTRIHPHAPEHSFESMHTYGRVCCKHVGTYAFAHKRIFWKQIGAFRKNKKVPGRACRVETWALASSDGAVVWPS